MSVRQKQTLTERAIEIVRRQIARGSLHKCDRLPSIREFMALHQMAKNTVLNAYGRLVKEGLIESRHGAGFFVTGLAPQRIDNSDTPGSLTGPWIISG
ncbi:GntR family transcriptional regulator [Salinicola acroporae]|uniref:GntR family transcriptional regulator n=1 Tax=Salinicola acroporae TaxID=1541440 RepID=UPI003CCE5B6F